MHWTFEARKYLEEAKWPTTKNELIDYLLNCTEAPEELILALKEIDTDDEEEFSNIDELWPDLPKITDYYFEENDEI